MANSVPSFFQGPFRKTCELTLGLLRQNEDSLMTILETFLHEPTTDFIGKKVSLPIDHGIHITSV